jgi:hypothetical protein
MKNLPVAIGVIIIFITLITLIFSSIEHITSLRILYFVLLSTIGVYTHQYFKTYDDKYRENVKILIFMASLVLGSTLITTILI